MKRTISKAAQKMDSFIKDYLNVMVDIAVDDLDEFRAFLDGEGVSGYEAEDKYENLWHERIEIIRDNLNR